MDQYSSRGSGRKVVYQTVCAIPGRCGGGAVGAGGAGEAEADGAGAGRGEGDERRGREPARLGWGRRRRRASSRGGEQEGHGGGGTWPGLLRPPLSARWWIRKKETIKVSRWVDGRDVSTSIGDAAHGVLNSLL